MENIFQQLHNTSPIIDQLNDAQILNIASGEPLATIHIDNWKNMLEGDLVELILDNNENAPIATQTVKQIGTEKYQIDPFSVPMNTFSLGNHNIYYKTTAKNTIGLPQPIVGYSLPLNFTVINDIDAVGLTVKITQGAAGFTDAHSNLLPANIAVIKGKPGTKWHARGQGKVQIYEAFGLDNTVFDINDDGFCSLTLIRVDHLDMGSASALLSGNALYITKENEQQILQCAPVIFDDYHDVPADAAEKFISYSYNDVGISDGKTTSIFSIILKKSLDGEQILVRMPENLTFVEKKLNVYNQSAAISKTYSVNIIENTAEFGIIATKAGQYKISISSTVSDETFTQLIEFKDYE